MTSCERLLEYKCRCVKWGMHSVNFVASMNVLVDVYPMQFKKCMPDCCLYNREISH